MKIVQYINDLIQENGSITIPDFGTFILKDTSTRIDDHKKTILPPSKVLTFDENIKDNNKVLIDYVVKNERISNSSAEDAIKKFVNQLTTLLNSGKTVEFRNIGKLNLNHKKQIVFNNDTKAEYVSESFGLTSIKTKTFSKSKEVKQMENKIENKIENKEHEPNVNGSKKKFPKAVIWLIIILVPILTFAVLAFLFPDKTKQIFADTKNTVSGLFKKSEPDKNVKTVSSINDTLKNNVKINNIKTDSNRSTENKIDKKTENNNNKVENITKKENKPIIDENKKYHIIVGCFQSKQNAEKYFKTIEGKGYTPRFFEAGSDGLYKISCGSYATREEANTELKKVSNDIGSGAWILKK